MNFHVIDKNGSLYFRGVAILMIAAHNFMHVLPPVAGENEFNFDSNRFDQFFSLLMQHPGDFVHQFVSYFGHYGVQVFIFLSAYGLTRRYQNQPPNFLAFIWRRIIRIYPAFLLSVVLWVLFVMYRWGADQGLTIIQASVAVILAKLLAIPNLSPEQALRPVGPWWFLPFIMQFYLVFPLLLSAVRKFGDALLLGLAAGSLILLIGTRAEGLILYYNLPGHLPEIALGMYLARKSEIKVPVWLLATAAIIFVWGNLNSLGWRFSHLAALLLLMVLIEKLRPLLQRYQPIHSFVNLAGALSLQIFFINGFIRDLFLPWAEKLNHPAGTILVCIVFLLSTLILAWGMLQLERRLVRC